MKKGLDWDNAFDSLSEKDNSRFQGNILNKPSFQSTVGFLSNILNSGRMGSTGEVHSSIPQGKESIHLSTEMQLPQPCRQLNVKGSSLNFAFNCYS
jgi:hypothetical protein